jgi:hypothetical protein
MTDVDDREWVLTAKRRDLLELIAEVARDYRADETPEDVKRRAHSVLWLATQGDGGIWHSKMGPGDFLATRRAERAGAGTAPVYEGGMNPYMRRHYS